MQSSEEAIKRKRAEIAAKLAQMTGKTVSFPSTGPQPTTSVAATPIIAPQPSSAPSVTEELARRVAEAKRRVAEASLSANPYLVSFRLILESTKMLTSFSITGRRAGGEKEGPCARTCSARSWIENGSSSSSFGHIFSSTSVKKR